MLCESLGQKICFLILIDLFDFGRNGLNTSSVRREMPVNDELISNVEYVPFSSMIYFVGC